MTCIFMSIPKATLKGIQKFKTWFRVNKSNVWHGAIRYGKGLLGSRMHSTCSKRVQSTIFMNTQKTATRIANLIPSLNWLDSVNCDCLRRRHGECSNNRHFGNFGGAAAAARAKPPTNHFWELRHNTAHLILLHHQRI